MTTFLPTDYNLPNGTWWSYFKATEDKQKIRVMSSAITWRVDRDKTGERPKPIRTIEKQPKLWENEPKHFRACVVYNYNTKSLQVWEITQKSIMTQLDTYIKWDRWNPQDYDIVIWKTGQNMDTKYFLSATPDGKKDLPVEITDLRVNSKIYLEALFVNEDPFTYNPWTEGIKF